jgi:Caspase domain/Domain of unknown function (DUF4384)
MNKTLIDLAVKFAACCALTLLSTATLMAQSRDLRQLTRATELRAEGYSDAAVLSLLQTGTVVEVLKTQGIWAQVKINSITGWVRFTALESAGAKPTGISQLETGRMAANNVLATSGIRSMRANRHALIVGVGEYANTKIASLTGVTHDIDSAQRMAHEMGIPDSNIVVLRDTQATLGAIKQALIALNEKVSEGDRVFFYFSGHGTRWFDATINDQTCTEALVPTDGQPLTNQAIAALLKPISDKTDKLLVFYDACHSGGIISAPLKTRSIAQEGLTLMPKIAANLAPEQCSVPTNMRTRSLTGESVKLGGLNENIVHISSSRSDEVSFDQPGRGGIATQAFRDCMFGEAKDLDGSGSLTVSEIMACAQLKVDKALAQSKDLLAPTMTVSGNKGFVPALFKQDKPVIAAQAPAQLPSAVPNASAPNNVNTPVANSISVSTPIASAPIASPPMASGPSAMPPIVSPNTPIQQASATPAAPTPAPVVLIAPVVTDPVSAFEDALAQANGKIKVSIKVNQSIFKIGKDELLMDVSSNTDGYVNIVMLGSDRQSFYMLFPNALDKNNAIKAGETLRLPRKRWGMVAQGPAGTDDILVVVTESPRNLAALGGSKVGPFLSNLTNADGRANLQWLLGTSQNFDSADCSPTSTTRATRGFAVVKKCSDSFGAARVTLKEEK